MWVELLVVGCLSHGLVSTLVHGIPAYNRTLVLLEQQSTITARIAFCVIWAFNYTIFAIPTFYRIIQPSDKWVAFYTAVLVEAMKEDEEV